MFLVTSVCPVCALTFEILVLETLVFNIYTVSGKKLTPCVLFYNSGK